MAGDFSKPVNTDLYATILQVIRENFAELAKGLDATTSLNLPIGAIRFNSSANRWEKWNGATWDQLATTYDINAATSAKLATPRSIALGGDVSGSASFDGSANISITAAVADNSHNHGTDTITSGTLGDARLPQRINTTCKTVTDWNNAIENGWYQGDSAANGPTAAWYMGTVLAHYAHWITQTVHQFSGDGSTDTISYRRERNSGTWGPWYRIRLSETEHAALWAAKTHNHTLDGLSNVLITGNTAGEILKWNGYAWVNNTLEEAGIPVNPVPAGSILFLANNSAPTGFLKANGALVSRTTYSALFAAIGTTFGAGDWSTTFNIPDLRGEFIRGWDDSRGVDPWRTLGTGQDDAFKSHTHYILAGTDESDAGPKVRGGGTYVTSGTSVTEATGSTETRPRNIALMACIKY